MKRKEGEVYKFDSIYPQQVKDWQGKVHTVVGEHKFVKAKDTIIDKLRGRSWYRMDDWYAVDVGRNSHLEVGCLWKVKK